LAGSPVEFALVRRVSVVGVSGAGKSTLARALARSLAVPHVELDSIYHQADWAPLPDEQFAERVAAAAAADGWVIDGNYSVARPLVWARADTVIWIDLPRRTVMRRLVWRTIRRVAGRQELWNGNRERWRYLFTTNQEESVIAWAWHKYPSYAERYRAAMDDPALAHLTFIRVSRKAERRRLIQAAGGS
jgi:adenylate kinase family enzyme